MHTVTNTEPASILIGQVATFSVYAKAGAVSWCELTMDNSSVGVYFNLTGAGVVGAAVGTVTGTIQSVGNSWYRCAITCTRAKAAGNCIILPASANSTNSYAAGDTSSAQVYFWGAQYVQANWAGPYQATTGVAVNNGAVRSIVPQAQNLLKFSEDFTQSGTWAQNNITSVAANQIANPINGAVNVCGLVGNTTSGTHFINQNFTSTTGLTYTCSVYAKAGNKNWFIIETGGINIANFNLTPGAGALGTVASVGSATIQALPNGWFYCTYTSSTTFTNVLFLTAIANSSSTFAGDGVTVNTYLYGAMVTQSNSLTEYTQTVGTAIPGSPERVLIAQNQNLITQSQTLANAAWSQGRVAATDNSLIAPDGTLTADLITDTVNASTTFLMISPAVAAIQGQICTLSVYAKAGTLGFIGLGPNSSTEVVGFNLTTQAMNTINGSANLISSNCIALSNGWNRCSITFINQQALNTHRIFISNSISTLTYSGIGTGTVYLRGAQFTQGNNPGPYQVTTATVVNTTPPRFLA